MVFVEGRMDVDRWQDRQSGARRSRMKVVAENVQFLRIKRPEAEAVPEAALRRAERASKEAPARRTARRRAARAEGQRRESAARLARAARPGPP